MRFPTVHLSHDPLLVTLSRKTSLLILCLAQKKVEFLFVLSTFGWRVQSHLSGEVLPVKKRLPSLQQGTMQGLLLVRRHHG